MERRYWITSGARGIGLGIARRLAGDDARVVIADLDADQASEAAGLLPGSGHSGLQIDVTDEAEIGAGFERAEEGGALDGVVCNAGVLILREGGERAPIVETEIDEWRRTHDVNLTGTFLTVREFLRRRKSNPVSNGRIVTFTSSAAQLGGYRSSSSYISSKSGVIGLTKAVARECAGDGITSPGGLAGGNLPGGNPGPIDNHELIEAPEVGLIVQWDPVDSRFEDELGRNWNNGVRFTLPDEDVFAIDVATPASSPASRSAAEW